MATEMRDYYQDGKKVGEFKVKNGLYLCYYPSKSVGLPHKSCVGVTPSKRLQPVGANGVTPYIRHETCENIQQMKAFFQRQR